MSDVISDIYYSKLQTSLSKNRVCRDSTIERQWPVSTDWMTWVKKWVFGFWLLLGPGSSVGFAAGSSRHSSGDVAPLIRVVGSEIGHSSKTSHCPCLEANDVVGVPGLTSEAYHKLLDVTQLLAWFVICVETAPQQTTGRTQKALPGGCTKGMVC